ncbi:hypothetical protein [Bacteriovorax sp. BSW11_IV]|uniref:hypothetical protein n=1 Tax=Bacteriovorax sp. BSW11_IV TaxID=1353529 RepID=UPI000406267B|nr:hypothetical protein [Bacteriovorax sp. BSW11_IV]
MEKSIKGSCMCGGVKFEYFVSAGVFDDEINIVPTKHIFVKNKCHWYNITDDITQIERY